jgi:hypothetical protein
MGNPVQKDASRAEISHHLHRVALFFLRACRLRVRSVGNGRVNMIEDIKKQNLQAAAFRLFRLIAVILFVGFIFWVCVYATAPSD